MSNYPRIGHKFKFVSALSAFVLWGGWAYFINGGSQHAISLKSGLIQGSASFIITLLMVHAVTWLYRQLPPGSRQLWLPSVITILCTGSGLATIHLLAGTPRILATIAPALLVALGFCLLTSRTLRNSESTYE